MVAVNAAQHFFTSVPAEQSPKKRRGYQTLFHTRGLPDEVIHAIEDRAQYVTVPGDPIKRQFYPLPHDLFAVSQTVALAEPDEFGRRGRYLAHTFILDHRSFRELDACPLDILTQGGFATTLDEVFRRGQLRTGEAPAVSLSIDPAWCDYALQASQAWAPDVLLTLGRLAWQAERLREQRETVALIGPEADQWATLSVLFLMASPLQRTRLSFDTHAAGCSWGPHVTFWIQGYADKSQSRAQYWVDTHSKLVTSALSPAHDGPFAIWMTKAAIPIQIGLRDFQQQQTWAEYLEDVLVGRGPQNQFSLSEIPADFLMRFARLNTPAIVSRWLSHLPSGLSIEFVQPLQEDIARDPVDYLQALAKGVKPDHIDEFMFYALTSMAQVPARKDQKVLRNWIKSRAHPGLLSLLPLWAQNKKAWVENLTMLPHKDYMLLMRNLIRWSQPPIPLWAALVHPHEVAWIRTVAPVIPPADWKNVFPVLKGVDEPVLSALAEVVPSLYASTRDEIARWLKGYKGSALSLRSALGLPLENKGRGFRLF
jgi:hypothetical protein